MAYHLRWELRGRAERLLDSGQLDETYDSYAEAAAAISGFVRPYAASGQSCDATYRWARRSLDADIEWRLWVEREADRSDADLSKEGQETVMRGPPNPWSDLTSRPHAA